MNANPSDRGIERLNQMSKINRCHMEIRDGPGVSSFILSMLS